MVLPKQAASLRNSAAANLVLKGRFDCPHEPSRRTERGRHEREKIRHVAVNTGRFRGNIMESWMRREQCDVNSPPTACD